MTEEIEGILTYRATILENIDRLYKYAVKSNSNVGQLSMFDDLPESKVTMVKPEYVNYMELLDKEKEAIGFCLTYNIFDEYILLDKKYCNNTISSLLDISESKTRGLVLLCKIKVIEIKISASGNSYAKLTLSDNSSTYLVYLWGRKYIELIGNINTRDVYLLELGFIKDGNTFFVFNARKADEIDLKKNIKLITLELDIVKNVPIVRNYIFENMLGSDYSLTFIWNETRYNAPYKINFTSENYQFLKHYIKDLKV